jgi:hypothetical protein
MIEKNGRTHRRVTKNGRLSDTAVFIHDIILRNGRYG